MKLQGDNKPRTWAWERYRSAKARLQGRAAATGCVGLKTISKQGTRWQELGSDRSAGGSRPQQVFNRIGVLSLFARGRVRRSAAGRPDPMQQELW